MTVCEWETRWHPERLASMHISTKRNTGESRQGGTYQYPPMMLLQRCGYVQCINLAIFLLTFSNRHGKILSIVNYYINIKYFPNEIRLSHQILRRYFVYIMSSLFAPINLLHRPDTCAK